MNISLTMWSSTANPGQILKLDAVDVKALNGKGENLFKVFWSKDKNSKVVLIGAKNQVELAIKMLQWVQEQKLIGESSGEAKEAHSPTPMV